MPMRDRFGEQYKIESEQEGAQKYDGDYADPDNLKGAPYHTGDLFILHNINYFFAEIIFLVIVGADDDGTAAAI